MGAVDLGRMLCEYRSGTAMVGAPYELPRQERPDSNRLVLVANDKGGHMCRLLQN